MKTKIIIPVIVSSCLILPSAFGQGVLTPSAPPGPTMVTLSQVEPRTPISSAPYTITQPGSYYLTGNLTVNGNDGIFIGVNNVTLDLRGFTISSTSASAVGSAIYLNNSSSLTNIAIYNGQISSGVTINSSGDYVGGGFLNGIYGVYPGYNVRVRNVSVTGVMYYGIYLGEGSSLVDSCVVNVAGDDGIEAGTVSDSTVVSAGAAGIYCTTANNCYATATGDGEGIITTYNAENCEGMGGSYGIYSYYNAENCYGLSTNGTGDGIYVYYNAENCDGTGIGNGCGIYSYYNAENCYGTCTGTSDGTGLEAQNGAAENCYGLGYFYGIIASTAENCSGSCTMNYGIQVAFNAQNCFGSSYFGYGILAGDGTGNCGTVENCYGYTESSGAAGIYCYSVATGCAGYDYGGGTGLFAIVANGCYGYGEGNAGLVATNATACYGLCTGGTGVSAWLANGCGGIPGVTAAHSVNSY